MKVEQEPKKVSIFNGIKYSCNNQIELIISHSNSELLSKVTDEEPQFVLLKDYKRVREQAIEDVINYMKERKRNAKNLYKMDNVSVSPKIVMGMLTKIINDCEKKFITSKQEEVKTE